MTPIRRQPVDGSYELNGLAILCTYEHTSEDPRQLPSATVAPFSCSFDEVTFVADLGSGSMATCSRYLAR